VTGQLLLLVRHYLFMKDGLLTLNKTSLSVSSA
jgi:hypothetical protein